VLVHNWCWDNDWIATTWEVGKAGSYGFFVTGPYNIAVGVKNIGQEIGSQAIDVGLGTVTAGSILVGKPVVFDSWSQSLKALENNQVSTAGYYGELSANIFSVGTYSQVQTLRAWWNGEITDNEASQRLGGTAMFQIVTARGMQQSGGIFTKDIPGTSWGRIFPRNAQAPIAPSLSVDQILGDSGVKIPDDAMVHFSSKAYAQIKPNPPEGNSYWFRYNDIKNMTPDQVRGAIGGLAHSGEPGGTNVIHVYQNKNVPFMKTLLKNPHGIFEWTTQCNGVIVDSYPLVR
jgi:hypothetical protein